MSLDYDAEEDIEFTQTQDIEVLSSFDTMGLKEDLLRGIYAYGTVPWRLRVYFPCPRYHQYHNCNHYYWIHDDIKIDMPSKIHWSFNCKLTVLSDTWSIFLSPGFERPSAIQQRAIKPIIQGRDVIAQSQSGTGKTAVFSIGVLQCVNTTSNETQALTLSPTRELAEQVFFAFTLLFLCYYALCIAFFISL